MAVYPRAPLNVVCEEPFSVDGVVFCDERKQVACSIAIKATFRLVPDECVLETRPLPIYFEDQPHEPGTSKGIARPSDVEPAKHAPEFVVVGSAYATAGPVDHVTPRVTVGEQEKSIEAWVQRRYRVDGALESKGTATRFPLDYGSAAAGPDNPIGVMLDRVDSRGRHRVPQLLPTKFTLGGPGAFVPVAGLGPVEAFNPMRQRVLREEDRQWLADPAHVPKPSGFDARHFQSSFPDQWLKRPIAPNEWIVLEQLHPRHQRIATRLPGVEPRAFAYGAVLPLCAEILVIDTDLGILTVTWRGRCELDPARPSVPIVVKTAPQDGAKPVAPPPPSTPAKRPTARLVRPPPAEGAFETTAMDLPGNSAKLDALPFSMPAPSARPSTRGSFGDGALPFQNSGGPVSQRRPSPPPPPPAAPSSSATTGPLSTRVAPPLTYPSAPPPPPPPAPAPASVSASPPAIVPPPLASTSLGGGSTPLSGSTSLGSSSSLGGASPLGTSSLGGPSSMSGAALGSGPSSLSGLAQAMPAPSPIQSATPPSVAPPAPVSLAPMSSSVSPTSPSPPSIGLGFSSSLGSSSSSPSVPPPAAVTVPKPERPAKEENSAFGSAFGPLRSAALMTPTKADGAAKNASDAAAERERAKDPGTGGRSGDRGSGAREEGDAPRRRYSVDLFGYEPLVLKRIRQRQPYVGLLKSSAFNRRPQGLDAKQEAADQDRDRVDVLRVLSYGKPLDLHDVRRAVATSFDDDQELDPPLVLVAGEVRPSFDELEALRATAAITQPLGPTEKKIQSAVTNANEALAANPPPTADKCHTLMRQLEQAASSLQLPPKFVATQVERSLLEQRNFKKRKLWGIERFRAEITLNSETLPCYIDDSLNSHWPLLATLSVVMLVELRPREDASESAADAFVVRAIGRILATRPGA